MRREVPNYAFVAGADTAGGFFLSQFSISFW